MALDNYRGARRVYAWTFYSQGTNESATSADLFIHDALKWFGDADPRSGSPWDKGARLAGLVQQQRLLAVTALWIAAAMQEWGTHGWLSIGYAGAEAAEQVFGFCHDVLWESGRHPYHSTSEELTEFLADSE